VNKGPWNPTFRKPRNVGQPGISFFGAQCLPRLPAPRIAPSVEAGDHHNPIVLNFEEDAVRKTPHSGTTPALVGDGKLQRMVRDCFNRGLDCQGKMLPKFRATLSYHVRASSRS